MTDGKKIVVYVRADDVRDLESEGKDVAVWIRALVRHALEKRREQRVGV